ncbi:hypothetical protein OEA41_004668 [Lepraria neglecta]|uniref:ATP-grasp domain-containing protein n=1 Tax=Lepraria neglecta TaxID=209136 RepID=A0AAE0DER3_9LECA|nr:hypothetical protein OEA41_004668 [Lepraria neglecta]
MTTAPLTIAFVYDDESSWLAAGFSERKTGDKADDHGISGIVAALEMLVHKVVKPRTKSELPTLDRVQHAIESSRHAAALQEYPLFAKPIGEDTSKGILTSSKIKRPKDLAPTIDELEALYRGQDVLLETFLSGREITVGIVGTGENSRVIGANEYVYKKPELSNDGSGPEFIDFASDIVKNYPMDENVHMDVVTADLSDPQVHSACQLALAAWKMLHCRHAGRIDTRFDGMGEKGVPKVMEVNPIPGIIPDWSDLPLIAVNNGVPYQELLKEIIDSALERTKKGSVCQAAKASNENAVGSPMARQER